MKRLLLGLLCLAGFTVSAQKYDGLALTPPMGWNSWNKFQGRVSDQLVREIADAMATNGMKAAGYQYVNLDDLWQGERDADGNITADAKRFPNGIKALADYVHSKGLKLGIYSDAGTKTCGGRPGSQDHEAQDAKSYVFWGVDYIKYDWCSTGNLKAPAAYKKMSEALRAAGRPILFSLCEWGNSQPWTWAKDVGQTLAHHRRHHQLFRLRPKPRLVFRLWGAGHSGHAGEVRFAEILRAGPLERPGHAGGGQRHERQRGPGALHPLVHAQAPLISGNDLRQMPKATLEILTNPEVIALNQDKLGVQALRYSAKDGVEVWFKPLSGGAGACVC